MGLRARESRQAAGWLLALCCGSHILIQFFFLLKKSILIQRGRKSGRAHGTLSARTGHPSSSSDSLRLACYHAAAAHGRGVQAPRRAAGGAPAARAVAPTSFPLQSRLVDHPLLCTGLNTYSSSLTNCIHHRAHAYCSEGGSGGVADGGQDEMPGREAAAAER